MKEIRKATKEDRIEWKSKHPYSPMVVNYVIEKDEENEKQFFSSYTSAIAHMDYINFEYVDK